MSDHITNESTQEIPCGFCQCGCGQQTNLAPYNNSRVGWIKGEPLRYVFGHQHQKNKIAPPNPSGLCMCGCGEKTKIAHLTDRARGWLKGHPILYIHGHKKYQPEPLPKLCECGCGHLLKATKSRFISGHNNRQPVEQRFWERVNKLDADSCWNWTASVGNHGYGTLSVNGSPKTTHRIAWELMNGPIPAGMHVLHRCDNRICCNPAHLFLGTNLDNIQDMVAKNRQAKGADKHAQRGEDNPTSILTEKQVIEIRQRRAQGEPRKELAKIYGVSKGHISNLCRRASWKHI